MSNTYSLANNDWLNILLRLCLALFFGGIIGLEREIRDKPAGLRTHMLVSIASAVFMLVILQQDDLQAHPDAVSRVIQGIATGVGFLGAGEILRSSPKKPLQQPQIHGLTSAAAIWVSAALGVTAGCGLWQLGLMSVLLCVLILRVVKKLEK